MSICDLCKERCDIPYDELCFNTAEQGWSNVSLDEGQLAVLSKVQVIQNKEYPLDLLAERISACIRGFPGPPVGERGVSMEDVWERAREDWGQLGTLLHEVESELGRKMWAYIFRQSMFGP